MGILSIELEVRPIGKEPVHGYQYEMSEELLFDSALCLGVKILDGENALADFVEFFQAPSGMVDLHEVLDGILLMRIDERRSQAEGSAENLVLQEPHLQGDNVEIGMLL